MTSENNNLDQAINKYGKAAKASSQKSIAKMVGFGAAAAGGLLTCNQAEADIVWSGAVNFSFQSSAGFGIDIDNDGNNDAAFGVQSEPVSDGIGGWTFFGQGTKGGFAMQGNGAGAYPGVLKQAFSAGTVSAGNVATANTGWMGWVGNAATTDVWGAIANPNVSQTGYVGLQFNGSTAGGNPNSTMNAWVKLGIVFNDNNTDGVVNGGDTFGSTIFEWAYNENPTGTYNGFRFGQSFSGTPGGIHIGAVPEPGSTTALALLALGAVGVRRRKKLRN